MFIFSSRVFGVLTSVTLSLVSSVSAAGECSPEVPVRVTRRCRLAIAKSIREDGSLSSMRQTLEASYPLKNCRERGSQRDIDIVKNESGKPVLEISSVFKCASKDEIYGYVVTGHYDTDAETYRLKGIALSYQDY